MRRLGLGTLMPWTGSDWSPGLHDISLMGIGTLQVGLRPLRCGQPWILLKAECHHRVLVRGKWEGQGRETGDAELLAVRMEGGVSEPVMWHL